jgi:hypothetical protein
VVIRSMSCRTVSRSSDIALGCCWSGEEAVREVSAITSGAFCETGSACGANQLSCGYELATISLTGSPYDCQTKTAETPMQKIIRKRMRVIKARLPTEDRPFGYPLFVRSAGRTVGMRLGGLGSRGVWHGTNFRLYCVPIAGFVCEKRESGVRNLLLLSRASQRWRQRSAALLYLAA